MDFNASPYWDDFEATNGALEKNYMRILFRPGFAVQARELTQIQSIVQNQIKQFGNHIFQDGSPVTGGHLTLDTSINYVKLDAQYNSQDIDLEDFFGLVVFNTGTPKTRAKVIQTYSTTTDRALLIKYIRGNVFSPGQTIQTASGSYANVNTAAANTGIGSVVSINEGVFYVDGFFVTVAPQTIVLDPYSNTPTYRIGLEIDEEIVTESIDNALLDPAQEAFNYQAPGAHRYQFALNLAKRTIDSIDDSRFFELLRVENGVITRQVNYPIYSELEKTLARRTYDESGNYAVKPFRVNLTANTPIGQAEDANTFIINVEPGKAYVNGFEFETIGTRKISNDRARTYKTNKDYGVSVYYGNRVQLTDVVGSTTNGIIFSDNLDEVDIHCVPTNGIDLSTGLTQKHYATRIGTAKLRNFERTSSTSIYYAYLTDINFTPIISTTGTSTSCTSTINLNTHFSSTTTDAYVGGTITMIDSLPGVTRAITAYDSATRIATLDKEVSAVIPAGQRFSISMPFSTAESIIIPNTSTLTSANLKSNVSITGKSPAVTTGSTILEDSSFNRMVFDLPNYYVRYGSDGNVDLYRKNIIKNQSFTVNGAVTISLSGTGNETFDFGTNGQLVSNADVISNIIVVPTSGSTPGQIVDLTTSSRSVLKTTSQQITIYTNSASGTSFNGDIYVTTKITNANTGFRRTKTLVEANAALTAGDTLSSATNVSGFTSVKLTLANGIAWYTSSNVIAKIPGERQSLFVADAVKIKKVYDSTNINYAPNTVNMVDITDRYTFDCGQTDNFYDHASIMLKPGASAPTGQTAVLFDYYTHTGTGYISANSYANTIYETEKIPIYQSSSGKNYNLRDCIDLRPIRSPGTTVAPYKTIPIDARVNVVSGSANVSANLSISSNVLTPPLITGSLIKVNNEIKTVASISNLTFITVSSAFAASNVSSPTGSNGVIEQVVQNYDFSGSLIPRPTGSSFELDYDYYLPRKDKLVVTKDKDFKILQGVPALTPLDPVQTDESMTIYTMYIPPYTATLGSVDLQFFDNRRYTMKDISEIDDRLTALQEQVKLNARETAVVNQPIISPITNQPKPIYATLVDLFNDLLVADTNNDFAASIENGKLSAYKNIKQFSLKLTPTATPATNNGVREKFVTMPYTETSFAEQKFATAGSIERVQTTMIAKFEGFITLTPESDYFYSLVHQPLITDSIGRFFELRQAGGASNPVLTSALLQTLGGGGYMDSAYINAIVAARNSPISINPTVTVPSFASATADTDPSTTTNIPINFAGVAPQTFLNNTWTGTNFPSGTSNPNGVFAPGWTDATFINSP